MPQQDYDELMKLTDSRYQLTMVVSRRAAQLKYDVTDTLTKRPISREKERRERGDERTRGGLWRQLGR